MQSNPGMNATRFVHFRTCDMLAAFRDVSMLKQAIDVGKAQGANESLIAEAQRLSHGPTNLN